MPQTSSLSGRTRVLEGVRESLKRARRAFARAAGGFSEDGEPHLSLELKEAFLELVEDADLFVDHVRFRLLPLIPSGSPWWVYRLLGFRKRTGSQAKEGDEK